MERKTEKREITDFGKEVKKKAVDKGINLYTLASQVGISPSQLSTIMYGARPRHKYLEKIAELLDIDISNYVA